MAPLSPFPFPVFPAMSRQSKAKRDQRKKQQPRHPFMRLGHAQPIINHAVLREPEGRVVAAIGLAAPNQWRLAIGGQTLGEADDPVPMLAMLRHLADVQGRDGQVLVLDYSEVLASRLASAAEVVGRSAEEHLAMLADEFNQAQAGEDDEDRQADAGADVTPPSASPADAATATAPADANNDLVPRV